MAITQPIGTGARTRTVTRTRHVPHTINGITHQVAESYTTEVPVPPRDWDRIVLASVTTAAAVAAFISITWTTAKIGGLLDGTAPTAIAYAAAALFELAWLTCMALEWLARHDPARARRPRRAGHAALALAIGAIITSEALAGGIALGVIGAAVTVIAKVLWTMVIAHHATPLNPRTQQWVAAQRAEVGGRLAMIGVRRELARAERTIAAEAAALGTRPDTADTSTDAADTDPDLPVRPIRPSAREATRIALASGITDSDALLRYARTATGDPSVSEETVARYARAFRKTA